MSKKTVLLIEDDPTLSDAFSIILDKEGFDMKVAFDGEEALQVLQTFQPDLILLDLLMPVMDGREFLRAFKNDKNIPIIVFSNLDAKNDVKEVMELGATRYMLKAWATPAELVRVIKDTIA